MEISSPQKIHIQDYNYNLPDDRIAKYPLTKRDNSKLLVYKNEKITDTVFSNINNFLPENCLMVFNNTKVIQARLHFQKTTGAQIEIFCLEPCIPNDYQLNFQQTEKCSWVCLIGNLKKWKEGSLTRQINVNEQIVNFTATRTKSHGDAHVIDFEWDNQGVTFSELLDAVGELPIPPYLNRATEEQDKQTYQTVYSKIDGSVAAPTAGLHFTSEVMKSLKDQGMKLAEVTLHVGAGTFRPVKSDEIGDHVMHSEFISVQKSFIEELIRFEGKVIAVGTTSVRTLESLYYIGVSLESQKQSHLHVSQWMPYNDSNNRLSKKDALKNILAYLEANSLSTLIADTQIIITPGYEFKIVNGIVTNFHQPQSTLLLLVSAFLGNNNWKNIYEHALSSDYRFLSYGDSSLLLKD
ncbi:MAG: S-adenosylmethionine:tRNA ribosyltransferase-isomerase [Dysgonomonas mossii]|uniref:S-adenosylmethionine:tRNA ribosyltransferase-isomerase n=1 Tax=Dysgonomonas mossii TaxID=163665 RepID=UPI001D42C376|nr:S-adenosylmethionine:tRNA ribosyltransferase-isomerase [Dysgonomonas mossii]MBS5796634.1 S-adenosylmethionine:tRNA ribosyltransferase-isomerase [Dysgonomonas mossii]MBS7110072.1 S-adenosylmethionine:tRNA ribosyltransferase-isomerase [Dysgonomonas mossii]